MKKSCTCIGIGLYKYLSFSYWWNDLKCLNFFLGYSPLFCCQPDICSKLGAFQVTAEVCCAINGIILPCVISLALSTPFLSLSLMLCFYFWCGVIKFLPTANGSYNGIYKAGLSWIGDISLMAFASLACNLRHNWTEQPDTTCLAKTKNQNRYFFQILLSRWTFL